MVEVRTIRRNVIAAGAVLVILVCLPAESRAELHTYGFAAVTSNSIADVAIGERQLFVDVSDELNGSHLTNQVLFTFRNVGPEDSSIARVYFDDGALLTLAQILDTGSTGEGEVYFKADAKPGNLPAGQEADFGATMSDGALPPPSKNGINPGESLGILCNIINTPGAGYDSPPPDGVVDFSDVIRAIDRGFTDPVPTNSLRIGVHVIAFADGKSESFVNNPPRVPLPAAALLGSMGLGVAGWRLRGRKESV
jgi:hypothetical protein